MSLRATLAAAIGTVVFLVLASTGVAFGVWTTSSSTTGSVTAATATMSISAVAPNSLITTYAFAGAVTNSPILVRSLTLTDTGTAPLNYTLTATGIAGNTLAPSVAVKAWVPAPTVACTTTPGSNATVGTLAALPGLPPGATSAAPGAAITLCISTQLSAKISDLTAAAPTTQPSITPTFTVSGAVGNWSAAASDTPFTQRVYQVAAPTAVKCTQNTTLAGIPTTAKISWTAPVGAPSAVTYSIVDAGTLAAPASMTQVTITGTSATFSYGNLSGPMENLLVRATESTYGSISIGAPFTLAQNPVVLGVLANAQCVTPAAS